jgi:lambda family phage tail tape measure protein
MTTKKLNIDILARDKSRQALSQVQTRLGNLKKSVFSLQSAFVGLGAGLVVKSFVNVGKEVESLQVRFKFLFGSAEEGAVAFENLSKFAGQVPFSLEEISRASGNLAVVADDANDLNRILEITGNVAAVTGLDFETTSSQIQRAFSGGIGAADLFRERGVRALLGFQAGAKVTAEETIARFEELFSGNGQFANATKDLATTLEGTISMIGDKYFNFQKDVASGFFDELKGEFGDLNKFLEENEQQIKDIAEAIGKNFAGAITTTSENLKKIAPTVKTIADALGNTINGFASLPSFVRDVGLVGALIFGKKGALALAGVSFLVGQIQELVDRAEELQNIKTRPIIDIENIDEARTKLKDTMAQVAGAEEKLFRNREKLLKANIDIFNLEDADLEAAKINDKLKEYITTVVEGRERIDSLTQKIAVLNALTLDTGNAYSYAGINISNLNKETKNLTQTTDEFIKTNQNSAGAFSLGQAGAKEYNEELKKQKLLQGIANTELERFKQIMEDNSELIDRLNESKFPRFAQVLKDAGNQTKQLDNIFSNTFNNFADTLADTLMTGKFAFKDFARSVIRDIARMIARQQALLFYTRAFNFLGGSIFGISLPTPPPAQNGRPAFAGQPLMVGETGKEMFVPQQNGYIVPNNQLSGAGATNINFTINTVDAQGVDELLTNRRSTIINVINDALNRQGKEALV